MSTFVSPRASDPFPTGGPSLMREPSSLGTPRRGTLGQPTYLYSQSQQQQTQTQQQRRSVHSTLPPIGATGLGTLVGAPTGVEGGTAILGNPSQNKHQLEGDDASNQFAHAAMRLLWGALREEEQQLQLDSPGRSPFLGWGPWGPRVGVSPYKAIYEENRNAFDVSAPHEWLPIPKALRRLLCSCNAAADSSGKLVCTCDPLPAHGFIPELNRLWVADNTELYLWEVGADEEAVERLSLPSAIESVVYAHISREFLPSALRSAFCWDDESLSTVSVVTNLGPSGCADSPPFSDVSSTPLHCLVVSVASSVRIFAVSATAGNSCGGPFDSQQQSKGVPRACLGSTVDFTEIGVAEKPRASALGGPLELNLGAAHRGSGLVLWGSSSSQQIYLLEVQPVDGPLEGGLGFPQLLAKRVKGLEVAGIQATSADDTEGAALRAMVPSCRGKGGSGLSFWGKKQADCWGLVDCRLVPLNPKLSDWFKWGLSALSSSLGLGSSPPNHSSRGSTRDELQGGEGLRQFQVDEPRGIVWALARDSSVSAFLLPMPNSQGSFKGPSAAKSIKTRTTQALLHSCSCCVSGCVLQPLQSLSLSHSCLTPLSI